MIRSYTDSVRLWTLGLAGSIIKATYSEPHDSLRRKSSNAHQYSPKSDMYALGHTIIESITHSSTTPLFSDISEDYHKDVYESMSEAFSIANIPYARTLSSFILELSDSDLEIRPDSIAIAIQRLSMVSNTTSNDEIVIEYSHISRNYIDVEVNHFLENNTSSQNVLIIDGSIGTKKEVILANAISKAQLSNYAVLNFSAVQSDRLSLQDIVNILAINLSQSESEHLTTRHHNLMSNLKVAEASGDLDNLGHL